MRKRRLYIANLCLAGCLVFSQLTGCSQNSGTSVSTAAASQETSAGNTYEETTVTVQLGENQEKTVTYLTEDLDDRWDEASSSSIVLADSGIQVTGDGVRTEGNQVIIDQAGTYVISGTMEDGQILITADKSSTVRLILNGVTLSNKTTSPIYAEEKCKVILTLADGTVNTISDASEYQFASAEEDEPNAAIFTKGDLSINGTGELMVQGNFECGIRSKGDLIVADGSITIDAADDGLKGKDSIVVKDGILNITAKKDGLKSNNDEDADKGYVFIDGGQITITAEDDGIQAETALIINNGEINILDSQEAMEGKTVDILGGLIKAVAQDDGINSAGPAETEAEKMMDQEGVYTRIAGGELWINASADGIDSNGDLYFEGGTLYLSGPVNDGNGIIDYNGSSSITDGTIFAAGSSGMMQAFGKDSTQNYLVVGYSAKQAAGTEIQLQAADGTVLGSYAPEKDFSAAIISTPDLETGSTYKVVTGEESYEGTIEEIATYLGTIMGGRGMGGPGGHGGMGGPGGRGGRGGMNGDGQMPEGMTPPENGEMPEGMTPPADGEMPEGMTPPGNGERPEGMTPPADGEMPEGMTPPGDGERPGGMGRRGGGRPGAPESETTAAAETSQAAETSGN